MKTGRLWLAAAVLAVAAVGTRAGEQDFTLVNKTGVEIHAVYVSPSNQNDLGIPFALVRFRTSNDLSV